MIDEVTFIKSAYGARVKWRIETCSITSADAFYYHDRFFNVGAVVSERPLEDTDDRLSRLWIQVCHNAATKALIISGPSPIRTTVFLFQ